MADRFERIATVALVLAAVTIAGATIHREFIASEPTPDSRKSEYMADWKGFLAHAKVVGNPAAPIVLVEFSDMQCPFCARFHNTVTALRKRYPNEIAVAFVHYPLPIHAQAVPAARAVECADRAGRWDQTLDFVFQHQDSLGKRPWTWYARGGGVSDTVRFLGCLADSTAGRRISAGAAIATSVGFMATPTVLLNGWRYGSAPTETELVRAIDDLLAGKQPYADFPKNAVAAR